MLLNIFILVFHRQLAETVGNDFPTMTRKVSSDALLSRKLSEAMRVQPFNIWKLKDRFTSEQDLGIDDSNLGKIIDYPYNKRLLGKLYKVLKGEDIYLTVIGGSNSGGAGLQEDEKEGAAGLFPLVLTDWWTKVITPLTASELHLNLVSIGGTGSDFYQYCHHEYLDENPDLVLLELSVNDLNIHQATHVNKSLALEQLTRQLLVYPTNPALIYLNLYPGNNHLLGCKNLQDYGQSVLSHIYEITSIRWRDLVCPLPTENVHKPLNGLHVFCRDKYHINLLGHAHVSLILINMIQKLLLKFISVKEKVQRHTLLEKDIPRPMYVQNPKNLISNPFCWTTITPNYELFKLKNNFKIKVVRNNFFKYWPLIRLGYACNLPRVCRADAFSGWVGTTPGAFLIISFTVPGAFFGKKTRNHSVVFATRTCSYCGKALVWLDNDYKNRKIVDAKIPEAQTSVNIIGLHVTPGVHTLTILVLESANITLAGIMLGPPDGPY